MPMQRSAVQLRKAKAFYMSEGEMLDPFFLLSPPPLRLSVSPSSPPPSSLQNKSKSKTYPRNPTQPSPLLPLVCFVLQFTSLPSSELARPVLSQQLPARDSVLLARYSSYARIPSEPSSSTQCFPVRDLHNPVLGTLGSLGRTANQPSSALCSRLFSSARSHVLALNNPSSLHTVSTTNIIPN